MVDPDASMSRLSDRQIADNIRRYRERGLIEGGPFSLAQLLAEQHRRKKAGTLDTLATAQAIVALAKLSATGLTTYADLWSCLRPGEPWQLFPCRAEITNALERVQHYCLRNRLPLLATLVVNKSERQLTAAARANIAGWAREHGMAVGHDPDAFVIEQQRAALGVTALPEDTAW